MVKLNKKSKPSGQEDSKSRNHLDLDTRVSVINDSKVLKQRQLAAKYRVSVGAVNSILQRKDEILENYERMKNGDRCLIRERETAYSKVNRLTLEFFNPCRSKGIPVSGPLLKEQALKFARELGIESFKASDGWLTCFKTRNCIVYKAISGEAKDVNIIDVEEWKARLPALCIGYKPEDIFNADETGLFFRALPNRTLAFRNQPCTGGKMAKNRLTVLFCASLTGETLKPFVIGRSQRPRCFWKLSSYELPTRYAANQKSWMTNDLFHGWLLDLDKSMRKQKRKILLFIDNAPCHGSLELENIKLLFFPPNCTSVLQPLDQGIIKSFKVFYKSFLLQDFINRIGDGTSATQFIQTNQRVNVLDSLHWISSGWAKVSFSLP